MQLRPKYDFFCELYKNGEGETKRVIKIRGAYDDDFIDECLKQGTPIYSKDKELLEEEQTINENKEEYVNENEQ